MWCLLARHVYRRRSQPLDGQSSAFHYLPSVLDTLGPVPRMTGLCWTLPPGFHDARLLVSALPGASSAPWRPLPQTGHRCGSPGETRSSPCSSRWRPAGRGPGLCRPYSSWLRLQAAAPGPCRRRRGDAPHPPQSAGPPLELLRSCPRHPDALRRSSRQSVPLLAPHSLWSRSPGGEIPWRPWLLRVLRLWLQTETQVPGSLWGSGGGRGAGGGLRKALGHRLRPEGCGEGAATVPRPRLYSGVKGSLLGPLQSGWLHGPWSRQQHLVGSGPRASLPSPR